MQDFQRARHAARARGTAAGDRRQARKASTTARSRVFPASSQVVREGNFLGVVAENEWAAPSAARANSRQRGRNRRGCPSKPSFGTMCAPPRSSRTTSPATSAIPPTPWPRTAPRQSARPTSSPSTPTARSGLPAPSPNSRTASSHRWSASQATHDLRGQLAEMLRLPPDNVRCIYWKASGCYGRNGHEDAAADAAILAKAVGRPVRVQWSRADEHGWDPKGPPTLIDLRATLGRFRQRHRLGIRSSSSRRASACLEVPLVGGDACGPAGTTTPSPGNIFQNSGDPLQVRQHQGRLPPAGDDAVPSVLDSHAGPDAEHLRQRIAS